MFTEKTTSNLGSALSQAANWPLALMTFATSCTKPPGDEFGPCAASNGLMSGFGSMPFANGRRCARHLVKPRGVKAHSASQLE